MYRSLLAPCLLGAVLAWPAAAAAQPQGGTAGCRITSFNTLSVVDSEKDKTLPAGSTRREARGTTARPVEVRCGEILLIAEEIDHLEPADRIIARGNVVFQQTGTRIAAERGEFDRKTGTGFFEVATGTLQLTDREIDRSLFGAQEPEAVFSAARIEKTGPQTYRLTDAIFSACVQPSRRWEVTASRLTFTVDKYAIMRGATLRVKDVPMLYLPVFYYPIQEDGRATGFLMPSYGSSSFRGFTLSNAFFWAMGRSHDATLYHDWFTSSGQGYGADYRYVAGSNSQGDARFYVIREKAQFADNGTLITPARRSYEVRGNISQSLPGRLRLQAQADYFTDVTTQQLYQVDLASFSRRSRYFRADLSGSYGRVRLWAQAERNDIMYGTSGISSIRYLPRTNVSLSRAPLMGRWMYLEGSFDTVSAVRYDDVNNPASRLAVFRTDGSLTMSLTPSLGPALGLDGSVSVRRTNWNLSRDPVTGKFISSPLARRLVQTRARLRGPRFTRVFNTPGSGFAERFKHVIEPFVSIQKTSSFDRFQQVVQFDYVDTVLGGTTQVTYGVTNNLLARVRQGEGPPIVRPVLKLEVSQTYYSNKLAASYDQQYQSSFANLYAYFPPPSNYSPVRGRMDFTPSESLGGQFTVEYDTQFRAVRSYSASLNTRYPMFELNGNWSKRQVIPGLIGYDNPLNADHFLTFGTRLKKRSGGASVGYSTTYDVLRERTLQQRVSGNYNAQCCGVAVDYAITNLSHLGLTNDKRFSISLTLAGIGSFTNPLGVFGNNGPQR